jgi:aminoglycoside phosphotransferase family enzyme
VQEPYEVSLAEKVQWLRQPDGYPDAPADIDVVETHFAWVFLSRHFAYKLRKPLKFRNLDLRSLAARKLNCERELSLNRRLAEPTYLGIARLARLRAQLLVEGDGPAVDWLVKMRRLPADRMLITAARDDRVGSSDLRAVVAKLAGFYRTTARAPWGTVQYVDRLQAQITDYGRQLLAPELRTAAPAVDKLVAGQCRFIDRHRELLGSRIEQGRVVDAHGDLRPEHVFLVEHPQIIDCLEFDPELRQLDAAAEIAFLALECERLEHRSLGERILELYLDIASDPAGGALLSFYRSVAALARALVSAWHLLDVEPAYAEPWARRASWYIDAAQASIDDAAP